MMPVRIVGILLQASTITPAQQTVGVPRERVEPEEVGYRVAEYLPSIGLHAGDVLIVDPRPTAATGEFVIATLGERAYIGRWWKKHGRRAVLDDQLRVIIEAPPLRIVGAVTLVVRDETR